MGSPQMKAPGSRELQGTLIKPKHRSLPQPRTPNCTAKPRVELHRAPKLHSQGTASAVPFANRARSLGDLQAVPCRAGVCQDTRVGFAPRAGGAAGWDTPPWNQQQVFPTVLQTKAFYPFSGQAYHGTASALNPQH